MPSAPNPAAVAPPLRAAVLRLGRTLRVERERSALSNNKVAILSHLAREGASTPSRIALEERQHPQSLTRPLAELEADGLVERTADAADARRSVLRATPAGRAAYLADMRLRDERLAIALTELDARELAVLAEAAVLLDRIGAARG